MRTLLDSSLKSKKYRLLRMKLSMRFWPSFLVLQLVLVGDEIGSIQAEGIPSLTKCGKVHLTVSSLKDSFLEMNWITHCDGMGEEPDVIALYNQDPRSANKPLHSVSAHHHDGYVKTHVKFVYPRMPGKWDYDEDLTEATAGGHCFPYWIASVRKNRIIDSNCLKVNPTWMEDNRSVLGTRRIGSIFLPGTHNSAAYGLKGGIFTKYVLNQNMDIWSQLVFGIRYLDFRIGYYQDSGFSINHDLVRISKLEPHLKVIRRFLEHAPKEIVVLDFHRFPYPSNFNNNLHRKLIDLINRELGHFALPPTGLQADKGPTLNEIWQHNKTLIICYGNRQIAREYSWLWSPLQQYWGNKKNVHDLKDYLGSVIEHHSTMSNPLWALMAELTLSPGEAIFNAGSNAKLADKVNKELTKWFRDQWPQQANIVASDYFLGNDLINVAIETNKMR